jgi:ribosomal protein S18 acetylase RimI-like enzyme
MPVGARQARAVADRALTAAARALSLSGRYRVRFMAARPDVNETLRPLEERDFAAVGALARTIWLAHYTSMITTQQIDYMLRGRFAADNLRTYVEADDRWMELLEVDGELAGYCSYALATRPGEMKLEQLYLLPRLHGVGLGARMLAHVERRSAGLGASTLILQVNKGNEKAIKLYRRAGFKVREEVVVDIGGGFVMDDYVMEKSLAPAAEPAHV